MQKQMYHTRRHSLTISSSINEKGSSVKKRICAEYLPKYHRLLKLSNKKVIESSQDRLAELTTKQIDRLIEMQKIKSLLNDNKRGIKPTHIDFAQNQQSRHPNVYQPNFIAKINRIAVQRNIRHLKSQQFDEATLSPKQLRERGLQLQKKNLRFIKQYKIDQKRKCTHSYEQQQQKSIDSIQDDIEQFEKDLQSKKLTNKKQSSNQSKLNKFRHKKANILSTTRWFNGMSTHYLNLNRPGYFSSSLGHNPVGQRLKFDRNFDLQYQNKYRSKTQQKFNQKKYAKVP